MNKLRFGIKMGLILVTAPLDWAKRLISRSIAILYLYKQFETLVLVSFI